MKKKFLFFVMVCIAVLCSACTREEFDDFITGKYRDRSPDSIEINVVVGGVDGGILNGARVCECGEQYAYYDDGILYYYEDKASEAKTIQCGAPTQMTMTEEYIYYYQGQSLAAIDLKTMEQHGVFYNEDEDIRGINVYSDEVLVVTYDNEWRDSRVYSVLGLDANIIDESGKYLYLSDKNHIAYEYGTEVTGHFLGKINEVTSFAVVTPEHITEHEGKPYVLIQEAKHIQGTDNNMIYPYKEYDHLICVDPKAETYESLYQTPGPKEQIVNFSIENNEMYLLAEGILYKADLKGEQRVELANYVGSDTLTFEYANDTLFVYDGYKLLGQYK